MLAFMAVTGLLGWLNIRGLAAHVKLPDELYAGSETMVSVRIENRKKILPSFLVSASVSGVSTSFILLDPGKTESGALLLSFAARGRQGLPHAVISSSFPVNFFVRYTTVPVPETFNVFPAPRPSALPLRGGKPDSGEANAAAGAGYDGELRKISDYRGGEPLKLIHWRLSAKHEVFKVKELTATSAEPLTLDIGSIPGRDLEQRLSSLSYLVNRLVKGGRPVGLKLGDKVIAPAAPTRSHRLKLLGELAVYGED